MTTISTSHWGTINRLLRNLYKDHIKYANSRVKSVLMKKSSKKYAYEPSSITNDIRKVFGVPEGKSWTLREECL